MSRTVKAHEEAAIREAITRRESQMTYDNEAIVRNAYHTAEGNVLDIPDGSAACAQHHAEANGRAA